MRNKRALLLIFIIVLVVVIGGVLLFLQTKKNFDIIHIKSSVDLGIPSDISGITTSPKNANVIIYSNGRNIVSQDISTGKVNIIAKVGVLPEINQIVVSPDENYLLLKSQNQTFEDNFYKQLVASKLPTDISRWWFIDRASGAVAPLPQSFSFVTWGSDSKTFYGNENVNGTSFVQANSVPDLRHKTVLETNQIFDYHVHGDNYLLRKGGSLLQLDNAQKNPVRLFSGVTGNSYFSPSGSSTAVVTQRGKGFTLHVNFGTAQKKLSIDVGNKLTAGTWNSDGSIFAYTASDNSVFIIDQNGQQQLFTKDNKALKGAVHSIVGNNNLIVDDGQALMLVGVDNAIPESANVTAVQRFSAKPDFTSKNPYTLYYEPLTNILSISISQKPVNVAVDQAFAAIKQQGIDPEAIYIKTYVSQAALRN